LTPEATLENTFTDRDVGKNKTYVYRITALDGNGNESEMSESISDIIEDGVR
jgi:fibronectin type 3 domain-containing protein